ncbi:DNA binding domain-containing protein [Janibacter hoylei PVAS-1]|uniref:DNA binding domain-containing protein n=1 Tax=Janibacter hoylei PVAS-1 TaxID=1210046 RepID=K1ENH3_9MICO|nr:helix-turn-helix domain-containing protein [Janibacter hoylei]EKA60753.1 DNA binding domain-containing protein [Janibacter hoylei PVAS-1]RWU85465.1 DNA-binding protein [Janibacter hoylei PVAS-1]
MSDLLTLDEVAVVLRTPVATLRYWRANNRGPAFIKLGRRIVCRRSDLDRWLAEQASAQTQS